jgi:hypothetical protein
MGRLSIVEEEFVVRAEHLKLHIGGKDGNLVYCYVMLAVSVIKNIKGIAMNVALLLEKTKPENYIVLIA